MSQAIYYEFVDSSGRRVYASVTAVRLTKTGQPDIWLTGLTFDSANSTTKILGSFNLVDVAPGMWNVVLQSPDGSRSQLNGIYGASAWSGFKVIASGVPTLATIAPTNAPNTGFIDITLNGTRLFPGCKVKLTQATKTDIQATNAQWIDNTKVVATFDLTDKPTGKWLVHFTNCDYTDATDITRSGGVSIGTGLQGQLAFIPDALIINPSVSSITPSIGNNDNSALSITSLVGTGFDTGATVKLTKTGQNNINATGVVVDNAKKIHCMFDLRNRAVGKWSVVVTNTATNSTTSTLTDGFEIRNPPPTISSITPREGKFGDSIPITNLAGTGFLSGAFVQLVRVGQATVTISPVVVVSPTKITCSIPLTNVCPGIWDVKVSNSDGQSATLANGFEVGI